MNTADYSKYEEKGQASNGQGDQLRVLATLAEQQRELEVQITKLQEEIEKKEAALKTISEGDLPRIMDELQLQEFSTRSGLKITVKEKIRAQISKDRNPQAIAWLDEHGFENLVKRQFIIQFNRQDTAWANKFEGDLKKRKRQLDVVRKQDVHSSTLVSFVTERLTEGDTDFPQELFGVHRQRYTKVEVK